MRTNCFCLLWVYNQVCTNVCLCVFQNITLAVMLTVIHDRNDDYYDDLIYSKQLNLFFPFSPCGCQHVFMLVFSLFFCLQYKYIIWRLDTKCSVIHVKVLLFSMCYLSCKFCHTLYFVTDSKHHWIAKFTFNVIHH